jgi:hypothetical protein
MRVPITFECRPTAPGLPPTSLPDELMIAWEGVPHGAKASIFLPSASADEILATAGRLYGGQRLTKSDPHTVECDASQVTFIPIPSGSLSDYAGLLTLDVPSGIGRKAPCKVTARQITNVEARRGADTHAQIRRKVLGSFQLAVPVGTARTLLEPEERLLAFFRWILSTLSSGDRWYPVIERYVREIALRVKIFGGHPIAIPPSQVGAIPYKPGHGGRGPPRTTAQLETTGKIERLIYDRFGDFEGFVLRSVSGPAPTFYTQERHFTELARWAWRSQIVVTVFASDHERHRPDRLELHAPSGEGPDFP